MPIWIQAGSLRLPPPETPIWMIGPGTGVAPFRAFIRERIATGATGAPLSSRLDAGWALHYAAHPRPSIWIVELVVFAGPMVLLFGCRSRAGDFLYDDEWAAAAGAGQLTLLTAFSRDQVRERARVLRST